MKKNIFRVTMKDVEKMRNIRTSHPLYDPGCEEDLSPEAIEKQMLNDLGYVVYARDVPAPLDNLEPGSVVVLEYDGKPAKWMNGTIYIRSEFIDKE